MFFAKYQIEAKLDQEITTELAKLESQRDDPEKYANTLERVSKLQKLKSEKTIRPLSMDTLLIVGANVFGILWVARYERENVIKSRSALNLVMKPKA